MNNAKYLILDIAAFILFALLHSILASFKLKSLLTLRIGTAMAFYRLGYNIFFLWFFFFLYENLPRPDIELFELKFPWDFIILIPQFLALAGIIWTFRFFSLFEFIGLSQIKRWKDGTFISGMDKNVSILEEQIKSLKETKYSENVYDEKLSLKIEGPYRVVRHPLYLFTIIFLILRPTMDLFYLVFLIFLIAYFYIGTFYEERKLVSVFGDQYREYQKSVPRLFPL
jgi:methanethiol S-methyltransferase